VAARNKAKTGLMALQADYMVRQHGEDHGRKHGKPGQAKASLLLMLRQTSLDAFQLLQFRGQFTITATHPICVIDYIAAVFAALQACFPLRLMADQC
jgi:hypothetical protein